MSAPVLVTDRLILRGHCLDDWQACVDMWADPAVTRFIGGQASTREQTWTRLLRYVGHWNLLGFGYWVICEKSTGRFAGEAGFADFRRDIQPSLGDTPEIGWALAPWAHGKGYGIEAVRAVLGWGDGHLSSPRTVCLIAPENLRSVLLAEKCGYVAVGAREYKGSVSRLFERTSRAERVVPQL
jgi:RimJ/RimL family protein N-acetyltransferase